MIPWAVVVVVGCGVALGVRTRPGPARRPPSRHASRSVGPRPGPAARLGGFCRRAARRPRDDDADRRTGRSLMAGVLVAPIGMPAAAAAALGVYGLDVRRRRRDAHRAADAVRGELPDVVDLLLTAVSAGLSVTAAVEVVARLADGPVSSALGETVARGRRGDTVSELEAIPDLLGEPVRPLVRVLVDGLRHGAPVIAGLERLSRDGRAERRRQGEIRARRTSVRLVFPLVVCLLPAFALLTVAPALVASLDLLGA